MTDNIALAIPFSGFYYSIHDSNLDYALKQMYQDDHGDSIGNLSEYASDKIAWCKVWLAYSEAYCEAWSDETGIACKFDKLESPRFYNFRTDQIIAIFEWSELQRIYSECDKQSLAALIKERCTSYDGFISFYSPDVTEWPVDLTEWESPQLELLVQSFASETMSDDDYLYLMDDYSGNGYFDSWLCEAMPDDLDSRLYKVAQWMEKRGSA